jgi:hypothetical protein
MSAYGAERKCRHGSLSGSYRGHCGKHRLVAGISRADPKPTSKLFPDRLLYRSLRRRPSRPPLPTLKPERSRRHLSVPDLYVADLAPYESFLSQKPADRAAEISDGPGACAPVLDSLSRAKSCGNARSKRYRSNSKRWSMSKPKKPARRLTDKPWDSHLIHSD